MSPVQHAVRAFVADEEGATMVEYGLMVALIAVVCAIVATTLGTDLAARFTNADTCVTGSACITPAS